MGNCMGNWFFYGNSHDEVSDTKDSDELRPDVSGDSHEQISDTKDSDELRPGVTPIIPGLLYQLCGPTDGEPEADIIFFHGLQLTDYADAYWTTWSSDGKTIWPQKFLGVDFPRLRILSVSYDSCALRRSPDRGQADMYLIVEKLHEILHSVHADVGGRPTILVGHCLGGLVIKSFLLMARTFTHTVVSDNKIKIEKLLKENLVGIFYYATPHGGSKLAEYISKLPENGPLIEYLQVSSNETSRLNFDFSYWRRHTRGTSLPVCSIGESSATSLWGIANTIIVDSASARDESDAFFTTRHNHITVCKPMETTDATYQILRRFIKDAISQKLKRPVTEAPDKT